MPDPPDIKIYARPRAEACGLRWPTFDRQIEQESRWRHWASPGVVLTSYSGVAKGVGQLHKGYYPEEVWSDPYRNIDKSIEIMAAALRTFGSYRKALAAYNWGPGNVGGYTKADGTVVRPWDGRRETISDQGRHYLDVILGGEWNEPTATVNEIGVTSGVVYQDFRDPEPAGRFASVPKGIILHGSRSGRAGNPKAAEYLGTARYEISNPAGLGWHATIGEGVVAVHMTPQEWGWNARAASDDYLAVEIAQATVDEPITDGQVMALADWIRTRVLPVWPTLPMHFPSHAEVEASGETGQHDGKSDVFPRGDRRMDDLRARLLAAIGTAPVVRSDDVTREEAEALKAENARLRDQVNGLATAVAVIADDRGDAIQRELDAIRAVREQFVGARPR